MAACEFPPPRAFDTGDYSPLIEGNDPPPEQSPDYADLYPEEVSHTPEDPETPDQSIVPDSVPVYNPSLIQSLRPTNTLSHLLVLPPPQQNVQRSSTPAPEEPRRRSWTRAVTPPQGPGASPLGSRVKK